MHHVCLRGLGVRAWFAMPRLSAVWIVRSAWSVVVGFAAWMSSAIVWQRFGRMVCLYLAYLFSVSVLCVEFCCLGVLWLRMTYVWRWSEIGGDIVPDVTVVSVSVVRMTSMRVAVWWTGSYRVGVVTVVWRLFSVISM